MRLSYSKYSLTKGVQKVKTKTALVLTAVGLVIGSGGGLSLAVLGSANAASTGGFNQYGYNYSARIFSGPADGVDKSLDGAVWGDPTYANDHLVMKWNKAWDDCNAYGYNDPAYCAGAWDTNEWNGMVPGGSNETEHVKIVWVGAAAEASPYWVAGGTSIWNNYEILSDQGMVGGQHTLYNTAASPQGLGANKNL